MKQTCTADRPDTRNQHPVIDAARDGSPVGGLTHNFYRYPARFSPLFVRSVVEAFSDPGDWVIDPFAGGGTTLVEALALGRNALGIDISSLSSFVCEAKTLILTDQEVRSFRRWKTLIGGVVNMHAPSDRFDRYASAGYYRNIEGPDYWRLRKAIEQCLRSVERLRLRGASILGRCVVLRCAQWALDARKKRPTISEFRYRLFALADEMLNGALRFRCEVNRREAVRRPMAISLNRSTAGAHLETSVMAVSPPKLIVTSPPYPGIHVLYHRWQIDGRREAPAPFWIAGKLDGAGSAYYTMGDRQNSGLRSYFENLNSSFRSVSEMAGPDTTIVQMVAFSESEWQLPRYLEVMESCGLAEEKPWSLDSNDGRLWRDVPNRKWHAQQKEHAPGAREVVLVHRKRNV